MSKVTTWPISIVFISFGDDGDNSVTDNGHDIYFYKKPLALN